MVAEKTEGLVGNYTWKDLLAASREGQYFSFAKKNREPVVLQCISKGGRKKKFFFSGPATKRGRGARFS